MSSQSARDPYLGLNNHIRELGSKQLPAGVVEGRVMQAVPLQIRAAGLDLTAEDLRIACHLTDAWTQQLMAAMGAVPPYTVPPALQAGDAVLLLPSADGQIYYIIDKIMEVST